jgi:transcriptional regulator with XRE-family HTH domain
MTGRHDIGPRLREWRVRRKLTQAELAEDSDISTRHLSFVETGRSRPSRDLVLRLAQRLELPLRECNSLLFAAGFAAEYPEKPLSGPGLEAARRAIDAIIKGHEPYPAFAVDRHWTLLASNAGFHPFMIGIDRSVFPKPLNVLRFTLDNRGLAPLIANYWQWRAHMLSKLARQVLLSNDAALAGLHHDLTAYPPPPEAGPDNSGDSIDSAVAGGFAVPFQLRTPNGVLSFFSSTTVFGTPIEVTLSEISLECFYPADPVTAAILHAPRALPVR